MRRAALLVVLLGVPIGAEAGHPCREVLPVVGYQQCGSFGGWSLGLMAAWEGGVSALRFGADRAIGGRSRFSFGLGRTFYVTSQLDVATISSEPAANVTERATMPIATAGSLVQSEMLFGAHRRYGQLTFAAEAGPGVRAASYAPPAATQVSFVVDVHPKLEFWFTPNVALGLVGGFDVVHRDGYSAALVLGFHLTPYDMAR